jgi:hypothetical protein
VKYLDIAVGSRSEWKANLLPQLETVTAKLEGCLSTAKALRHDQRQGRVMTVHGPFDVGPSRRLSKEFEDIPTHASDMTNIQTTRDNANR